MSEPKILIIRLSSLGDILHAFPAFADLRKSFPGAQIDWLVGEKFAFLLSAIRGVDAIHKIDAGGLLKFPVDSSAWGEARRRIRKLRAQRYDFSIDFQGLLKTAFLGCLSRSRIRIGFSKTLVREPPAQWFYHRKLDKPAAPVHVTELNRMLAQLAGARRADFPLPDIAASDADSNYVDSLLGEKRLKNFAVINPGGGWPTKRWRPERYGALAAKIQAELKIPVLVTTGPGEESYYEAIAKHCGAPAPQHLHISFIQLIPLLKKSLIFIGGDTGPFHLACALGTPAIGIFGPTSPVRNGPWKSEDEAVTRSLPCGCCHKRSCSADDDCMDIDVGEVFAAVRRRLEKLEAC